jgi:hypothetical protein
MMITLRGPGITMAKEVKIPGPIIRDCSDIIASELGDSVWEGYIGLRKSRHPV